MDWKKGRRSGRINDERGNRRIEALLSRSPTYTREVGPEFARPDTNFRDSRVSEAVRDQSRGRSMAKGGVVGNGCAVRGKTKGKNR